MNFVYLKEALKDISDLGKISGMEDEGGINLKNIDIDTSEKGISDLKSCSISGEEKVNEADYNISLIIKAMKTGMREKRQVQVTGAS